ncbi:hypothetical protein ACM55F_09395 [Flavobacterium sp. XS2P12]|uniref:hypothetical protein n=1 Tax=Flavobacterium melibiosi TaxID=3398734 RepID=UPI003A8B4891
MCIYYERIENIEQPNSPFPLITVEHKCSKVFVNELGQEVRIVDCTCFKSFTDCEYFENKNNEQK